VLGRIFEPFFSGKRFTEQSGTGLGLAVVHGVVKEHGGFLDVVSSENAGTTFSLYLPRSREQVIASATSIKARGGNARVLLVDDAQVQLRTARRVLSHFGYSVDALSSGSQAYEKFCEFSASGASPYDLVILDMLLNEDRDGLEILDAIRQLFPNQKAILVTGHAPNERVELAITKGLTWLAKPYTADELAQVVQKALAETSAMSTTQSQRSCAAVSRSSRPCLRSSTPPRP
jgi:CheY-like chemotaxis protein